MKKAGSGDGIKIRVTRNGALQLFDRASGKWIATVKWRPRGELRVRLEVGVEKRVVRKEGDAA